MLLETPPVALRFYRVLLALLAVLSLGFYLACLTSGVIRLCFYDDLAGLGLMALGLLMFQAARLALGAFHALRPAPQD